MTTFFRQLFILSLLSSLIIGCEKEDSDCGCDGEVEFSITESEEQIGYLYRSTDDNNSNVPDYNFGIWYSEIYCINCVHKFFICNDSFLNDLGEIPPYPGIEVKFSGHAKSVCEDIWRPAEYTYNHIILTKIELLEE